MSECECGANDCPGEDWLKAAEERTKSNLYAVIFSRPNAFRPFAFRKWRKWAGPEMRRLSDLLNRQVSERVQHETETNA